MKRGFSLIEALVVSAILITVSVGAVVSFSAVINSQRYTLRTQRLLDQGNHAMEYMGKALRMAKRETGEASCLSLNKNYQSYGGGVKFIYLDDDEILRCRAFYADDGVLIDYEQGRSPEEIPLTSSKVEITSFGITITDFAQSQPFVEITLELKPADFDSPKLRLSTSISQRELNLLE